MAQFNVCCDDDIKAAVDRFCRALKDFVNVALVYDDGGAMENISEFFDVYEWNAHTNTFQKKRNENDK